MTDITNPPRGIIEMYGLCGAGKTTILSTLIPILKNEALPWNVEVSLPIIPKAIDCHFEIMRLLLQALWQSPKHVASFLSAKKNWWLPQKLGYRSAGIKRCKKSQLTLLVDSGVLQPFVSFCVENYCLLRSFPFEALWSSLILPKYTIYVCLPPEVALDRYLKRESKSHRKLDINNIYQRFNNAFEVCEKIFEKCQTSGFKTIKLYSDNRVEEEILKGYVRSIINTSRV